VVGCENFNRLPSIVTEILHTFEGIPKCLYGLSYIHEGLKRLPDVLKNDPVKFAHAIAVIFCISGLNVLGVTFPDD
jgi:hypothetical protein